MTLAMAIVKINAILQPLIPGFLDNRKTDLQTIQSAIQDEDFETIRVTGHNLRGCGSGYGFNPITDLGGTIEKAAKEQDMAAIQQALGELTEYIETVEPVFE